MLKNSEGKYLLLKRNPEKYPDMKSGWWDIPGGRIDAESGLLENLKREIREETRLELIKEPKLIAAQDIIRPGRHVVRLTFIGELDGEPRIDKEHVEAKWVSSDELRALGSELDGYLKELIEKGTAAL